MEGMAPLRAETGPNIPPTVGKDSGGVAPCGSHRVASAAGTEAPRLAAAEAQLLEVRRGQPYIAPCLLNGGGRALRRALLGRAAAAVATGLRELRHTPGPEQPLPAERHSAGGQARAIAGRGRSGRRRSMPASTTFRVTTFRVTGTCQVWAGLAALAWRGELWRPALSVRKLAPGDLIYPQNRLQVLGRPGLARRTRSARARARRHDSFRVTSRAESEHEMLVRKCAVHLHSPGTVTSRMPCRPAALTSAATEAVGGEPGRGAVPYGLAGAACRPSRSPDRHVRDSGSMN